MRFIRESLLSMLMFSALTITAVAEDQEQDHPDADLLEFLGIWDQDDEEWGEFVDEATGVAEPDNGRSAAHYPEPDLDVLEFEDYE